MSFNRKNWSTLSSLARQRTLEDEEELERERRRRLRSQKPSISGEEEDLPPSPNASHPVPDRPKEADPPAAATPEEDEQKVSEGPKTEEVRQQRQQVTSISENVKEEKEPEAEAEAEAGPPKPAPWRQSAQVKVLAREFSKEQMDPRVDEHPESAPEPEAVEKEQHQQPASHEEEHRAEIAGQPQEPAQEQKGRIHLEIKAVPKEGRSVMKTLISPGASPSGQPDTARNPLRSPETARSVPASQEPEDSSVASHTTLDSLSRCSPRTLSFRVMSRSKKQESPFTRSASVRLPASSVKLEEKLQKYTSIVQRSELIKAPGAAQRGFVPSSESVASKRSIFEASATSRADQAPARKENLKIPNVVSSRINLWIRRTQEPSNDSGAKDTGKMNSSAKHNFVTKWPKDSASDTKL
ncbi:PREDICTED: ladinin-1 isoform X2 [Gavialis gangeticus]|uniref:ladinin-1 isoform X2 n=1 Tax=Gavialis gangeticus TaxID=94835 RepID=UPI00092FCEA8|nr:PREDICTED: ladinin-1 isoform X2 [Gavialis gangeticus]